MSTMLQVGTSYRAILKIAGPIALALLVPQLNLITNSIFLGYHSERSLAFASLTGIYYLAFAAFGFGLNNGLQTLLSRRAGQNQQHEIGPYFTQAVIIALVSSAGGIALTFLLAPPVFKTFLHPDQANEALSFLWIRIFGLPFLYVYQLRNALLVSINRSRLLILGTLAEAVANVIFDYVLIFGKLGLPAMGFNGAAMASVISEFIGMVTIFLVIKRQGITNQFSLFGTLRPHPERIRLIIKLSSPLIFQHCASVVAWLFFYFLIARNANQTGLAISTTMRAVFGFFGAFFWSLAATTNTMVSNVIGQGLYSEVLPLVKRITRLSFLIALAICFFFWLTPELYLSLFRADPSFIEEGKPVLRTVGLAILILSAGTVWLNTVTGTGNTRVTFAVEIFALVFYCLYVFYVMEIQHLSIIWGWASELLYWSFLLGGSYYYLTRRDWTKKII